MILQFFGNKSKTKEASSSLFKRNNGYFLITTNKTTVGVWIGVEPCISLPLESSCSQLGTAIRECLAKSETNVQHPNEWKGAFDFVLKKAGVRSYKQFMNDCLHCRIYLKGNVIVFTHSVNEGSKGFLYTDEPNAEYKMSCSDDDLGKYTFDCLGKCK